MTVIQYGDSLECTAYRTVRCVSCRTCLGYEEQEFWQPVLGHLKAATANLLARAAAWKAEPLACDECPDKAVA